MHKFQTHYEQISTEAVKRIVEAQLAKRKRDDLIGTSSGTRGGFHPDAEAGIHTGNGKGQVPDDGAVIPERQFELVKQIQEETDSGKLITLVQQLITEIDQGRVGKGATVSRMAE